MNAAAEFVAERGFHGMSMRDLAKATGKNISTLYNDFPSKEALLLAIQLRAFQNLCDTAEQVCAQQVRGAAVPGDVTAAQDRLFAFIYQHVHYVLSNQAVMRLLVTEASALDPASRAQVRALKTRYFVQLRDIVAEFCTCPPGDRCVEVATYNIFGMLNWVYGWHEPGRHGDAETLARSIYRMALSGLGSCSTRAPGEREPGVPALESSNLLDPVAGHDGGPS
ncbi:MAG: TetR/AcrR family transcriptional regulator [Deltaproteobacteria bacterium]|nr:TetR/AcrR family transcriptional regulator [Deltaproteobacteria bacterium]